MMNQPTGSSSTGKSDLLKNTRAQAHPHCVVCNPAHPLGLGQDYTLESDGSVMGTFPGHAMLQGYPGLLHGGMTASLLDGAMTNCLFARGVRALTAELTVRYREPVSVCEPMTTSARLTESIGRLHLLRADLRQDGRVKATALGKFIEPPA